MFVLQRLAWLDMLHSRTLIDLARITTVLNSLQNLVREWGPKMSVEPT